MIGDAGRSRDGYSTKPHVRVVGGSKPVVMLATAGQRTIRRCASSPAVAMMLCLIVEDPCRSDASSASSAIKPLDPGGDTRAASSPEVPFRRDQDRAPGSTLGRPRADHRRHCLSSFPIRRGRLTPSTDPSISTRKGASHEVVAFGDAVRRRPSDWPRNGRPALPSVGSMGRD